MESNLAIIGADQAAEVPVALVESNVERYQSLHTSNGGGGGGGGGGDTGTVVSVRLVMKIEDGAKPNNASLDADEVKSALSNLNNRDRGDD